MSRKTIDRTGEININNFGSEMVVVGYRMNKDMDVYFPKYNWTAKGVAYCQFKNGKIKCPYEKRYCGTGYLSEGKYKAIENGKLTKSYKTWFHMLNRCYDDNFYEVEGQRMHLDKDILNKGNKIYSSDNCVFVPERINTLFIKSDKCRGELPIGVYYNKHAKKFQAQCLFYNFENNKRERKNLGLYNIPQEAFEVYKQFKENYIKEVAEYYKDKIPQKLYDAMYKYEVDIDD